MLDVAVKVIAVISALYHLISTQYPLQTTIEHQNTHFAFALVLVLLTSMTKKPKGWPFLTFLLLIGLAATGYIQIFYSDLLKRIGFPTTPDMIIGIALIIIALETTRQAYGAVIPGLAIVFIAYDFLGQYLPRPFYHAPFTLEYVISLLSVGFSGMYGTALGVSVNYIFLFFLFGGLLRASGAIDFFMTLGKMAGQKLRGGPAQTAVIASMMVGSVTGSPMANVAITGAFTIPLMKAVGYRPAQAGAIEAAASTGGQIMPPVMGAAAFLMVGITGIAYVDIMVAALIPALIFYLAIGIYAELQARALNITPAKEKVDIRRMLLKMPTFVVPLGLLFTLMFIGRTPMFAAFWAIVSLVLTGFVTDLLAGERPSLHRLVEGITVGATGGAQVGVTAAVIGFMMVSLTMTGIGVKLSGLVEEWSMGILPLAAVITMFISILFGMGVPTLVAYALVALLVVPVLMEMGVPMLQAHFYCFFFAVFSGVTPPVALSALVGASIAGASYFRTSLYAFKICAVVFVLPYLILYNPAIILQPESILVGVMTIIAVLTGMTAFAAVTVNHYISRLTARQRIGAALSVVLLFVYAFTMKDVFFICGIVLFVLFTVSQLRMGSSRKSG